jgi:hypothetical protein
MEFDLFFILSAIYCGIGVVFIAIGMLFKGSVESREKFEKDMYEYPFRTLITALVIMSMMTLLWFPYLIWAMIDDWNKTKTEGEKQ